MYKQYKVTLIRLFYVKPHQDQQIIEVKLTYLLPGKGIPVYIFEKGMGFNLQVQKNATNYCWASDLTDQTTSQSTFYEVGKTSEIRK